MKGENYCKWIKMSSIEICGRRCINEYCFVHRAQQRKTGSTRPCQECGRGIKNGRNVCGRCGYHRLVSRDCQSKYRAFAKEFKGLAAIDISY